MPPRWLGTFVLALTLATIIPSALCGTVLTVITPGPQSHLFGMKKVSEEVQSRGHAVAYLAAETDAPRLLPSSIPQITYQVKVPSAGMDPARVEVKGQQAMSGLIRKMHAMFASACGSLLANSTAVAMLQDLKPDLLLATFMYPCVPILASRLNVSYVNYFPAGPIEPFFTSLWRGSNRRAFLPNPLSYFPQSDMHITSQHMTYTERLHNFYLFWRSHVIEYTQLRPHIKALFNKYGLDADAAEERRRLVLHVISADFAVEWTRPMPPHAKMVGPILPEPAKPLPAELEEFMEGAGEPGVLLVATGTVATLGLRERQAMAAAFAQLPVRVLWRLSKSEVPDQAALAELSPGNNTRVVTWLPQNDVLGHPRTKAFLSHCGANSLYESSYHGVPIVALPFFADQPGNADKAVAKGFAVRIRHADLVTDRLPEALMTVLSDGRYAEAAARVSVKLRARKRTPVQEAADWIEHALATGGEAYLMTPENELSVVQRHNLDVHATYLGGAGLVLLLARKLVHAVLPAAARKRTKIE